MSSVQGAETYSFATAFAQYGENPDTISQEIKQGVTQAVLTTVRSQDFARLEGAGIESIENELNSYIQYALYRAQIVQGIQAYNETVDDVHKVVISQELVDIDVDDRDSSVITINIRYIEQRSISNPNLSLQQLLIPLGL